MKTGNTIGMTENTLNKKLKLAIWIFTAVVYILVVLLHELPAMSNVPSFVAYLPAFNAIINGISFVLLILALVFIKMGKIPLHKAANTTAMVLAVVFLLSYVTNHTFSGDTIYGGDYVGLYYFVLISHIFLAALSLPLILFSYAYGYFNLRVQHKKWVRVTYPMWLYVTFTGVLVYLFLAPYYV